MRKLADETARGGGWFDRHQKGAWIAAGATIVAAFIAALVPVLGSSGDDKNDGAVTTPSASGSTSGSAPATPPSQTPSSAPSPSASPAGGPLWQGKMLLDTEARDLDAAPPERVGYSDTGDVYMLLNNEMSGWNETLIAQWTEPGGLPGPEDCSNVVDTLGSRSKVQLTKKTVLCVRTSERNIARLKVATLDEGGALNSRATFDTVVWPAN
ncbi:hypothetical protein [Kribbella speibonae]|uniref:Uncharacterized protein n=1 Tax=Kribbella speibonae TaxID=1572660 RepID=A0A4R0IC86_9ACTN|nr:hypothetical protein [Kribbella speibonae]TCC30007.1 hypothetical protein E0H92_39130 [Kribbella speibonae]